MATDAVPHQNADSTIEYIPQKIGIVSQVRLAKNIMLVDRVRDQSLVVTLANFLKILNSISLFSDRSFVKFSN